MITWYINQQLTSTSLPSISKKYDPASNEIIYQHCYFNDAIDFLVDKEYGFGIQDSYLHPKIELCQWTSVKINHDYHSTWVINSEGECTISDENYKSNAKGLV